MRQIEEKNFEKLLLSEAVLLDVRAPTEYERAHLPHAVNIPILRDDEREQVGTTYRKSGREAAKSLGYRLVSGPAKQERISAWRAVADGSAAAAFVCARGGLRSQIAQEWLAAEGVALPRVRGGYKALRNFLLSELPALCQEFRLVVLAGYTGSGKSQVLRELAAEGAAILDLERLANHRGSAFGALGEQPQQATFENMLAVELLKLRARCRERGSTLVLVESESRSIGRNWLPAPLLDAMKRSNAIELVLPIEERVAAIVDEYVVAETEKGPEDKRDERISTLYSNLSNSLGRIERRLGSERMRLVGQLLLTAFAKYRQDPSPEPHFEWVRLLLEYYYDPLYEWQFSSSERNVLFRGKKREVLAYVSSELRATSTPAHSKESTCEASQ